MWAGTDLSVDPVTMKVAQRLICSLAFGERVGVRENGMANFIIWGGDSTMTVRLNTLGYFGLSYLIQPRSDFLIRSYFILLR